MQPTFSIIIGTARQSQGAIRSSSLNTYEVTLKSLELQTCKDFEVIFVDALYKKRDLALEIAQLGQWSFPWRVVRPKSPWHDQRLWSLQNSFNRGFAASHGKYVYFCGDCCEFPSNSFETAKRLTEEGYSPQFLFAYKFGGFLSRVENGCWGPSQYETLEEVRAAEMWKDGLFHRDSRWTYTETLEGFVKPSQFNWDMVYGYSCVKREDFLYVNGYDENFDGDKALGDVELGSRLQMANRWSPCLSKDLFVYEHQHNAVDSEHFLQGVASVRSNYDLIYLMRSKQIWRANSTAFTQEECSKVIRGEITNIPAWPQFKITPDEITYQFQRFWMDNVSIFELVDIKC